MEERKGKRKVWQEGAETAQFTYCRVGIVRKEGEVGGEQRNHLRFIYNEVVEDHGKNRV